MASPRKTANRSHKPTPDVSLYSRPGEYTCHACVHIVSLAVETEKNSNENKRRMILTVVNTIYAITHKEAPKKFRTSTGFEPIASRY